MSLTHQGAIFADSLESLNLERNLIIHSLLTIISRLQLPIIKFLDLNLNQIEWEEEELKKYHYKVIKKIREKKKVGDKILKVRSNEVQVDSDLIIKVMAPEELYKEWSYYLEC